jgi:hypothetical protein
MGGHLYVHPIRVKLGKSGMPARFRWHGSWYPISAVFATWHLMDRWWERPQSQDGNPATKTYVLNRGASDRTYYRVLCSGPAGEQVFDLYYDATKNLWVLDTAHD